jgi:hypothetical protein
MVSAHVTSISTDVPIPITHNVGSNDNHNRTVRTPLTGIQLAHLMTARLTATAIVATGQIQVAIEVGIGVIQLTMHFTGGCQHMAPEYSKVALSLHPLISLYTVDYNEETNKWLCAQQVHTM